MTRGKISGGGQKNSSCLLHKTARYCRQSPSTRAHAGAAPSPSTVTRYENTSAKVRPRFAGLLRSHPPAHSRRLEGHGVLGEEFLALGRLGNDAAEGLQGDGRDDGEGGEEEDHRGAEDGGGRLGRRSLLLLGGGSTATRGEGDLGRGRPMARFLVLAGALAMDTFFLASRSAPREAASAAAAAFLSASAMTEISWTCASAGSARRVSASAPATADLEAPSAEALAWILRATFLGAAARATTTGVETRDIIFLFCGLWLSACDVCGVDGAPAAPDPPCRGNRPPRDRWITESIDQSERGIPRTSGKQRRQFSPSKIDRPSGFGALPEIFSLEIFLPKQSGSALQCPDRTRFLPEWFVARVPVKSESAWEIPILPIP